MKKALIFWGGWDGHDPELVANRFKRILEKEGFDVTLTDSQDALMVKEDVMEYDLLVP